MKETDKFHIMVLKGMFLYVIKTYISTSMVILRCKQFLDWLTQNVSNSEMGYQFAMHDLSMQLA